MSVDVRTGPRALALSALLLAASCGGEDEPAAPATVADVGLDADPFAVVSDAALTARLAHTRARAAEADRRVLLLFVADWCEDCHEVVRLARQGEARRVIEERYVVVYVDIGRRDRHVALLDAHAIDRIAALVVLDPATGERVAKTTLEPITGVQRGLTSADLARWLRAPSDG